MDVNFSQNSLKEWLDFAWKGVGLGVGSLKKQLAVWKKIFWFVDSVWNQTQPLKTSRRFCLKSNSSFNVIFYWLAAHPPQPHCPGTSTQIVKLLNSVKLLNFSILHIYQSFTVKKILKNMFDEWSRSEKAKHLIMMLCSSAAFKI